VSRIPFNVHFKANVEFGDKFGQTISVSGNTIVVGAEGADSDAAFVTITCKMQALPIHLSKQMTGGFTPLKIES
jgi:hypothetical protein